MLSPRFLERSIQILLAIVIVVAPFMMGGRHPIAQLVYVSLFMAIGLLTFVDVLQNPDSRSGLGAFDWLIVAMFHLVLIVQLLPLAGDLLQSVSPGMATLLPLWFDHPDQQSFLQWQTISIYPTETRRSLVILCGFAIFLAAVVRYCNSRERIGSLLTLVAVAGVSMAVFGLIQYVSGTDKFFWIYEHPVRAPAGSATGMFANRNHFAHFIVLSIPAICFKISSTIEKTARQRFDLRRKQASIATWSICLLIAVIAIALSGSRGGFAIAALTVLITAILFMKTRKIDMRIVVGLCSLFLVACGLLALHGEAAIQEKLESIRTASSISDLSPERIELWTAHLRGFRGSPWFGYGAGCHEHSYRSFMNLHLPQKYTHGESGYMSVAHEMGAAGLLIVFLIIGLFVTTSRKLFRNPQNHQILCAVIPMGCASIVHSLVDFVWYIPACAVGSVLALAMLRSLSNLESSGEPVAQEKLPWLQMSGLQLQFSGLLVMGILVLTHFRPLLDAAVASRASDQLRSQTRIASQTIESEPTDHRALFKIASRLLAKDWTDANAHLTLAKIYLTEFNAVRSNRKLPNVPGPGDFESQTRDQVEATFGDQFPLLDAAVKHAWWSIQFCPLESEAYVMLADLHPILGVQTLDTKTLLDQAMAADPHSGSVLYRIGQQYALSGDYQQASTVWSEAFRDHPNIRNRLVDSLWGSLPQSLLLDIFKPDANSLKAVYYQLQSRGRSEALRELAPVAAIQVAKLAETQPATLAAVTLYDASCYAEAGNDIASAIKFGEEALKRRAGSLEQHRRLAALQLSANNIDDAKVHLKAILRSAPGDAVATQTLAQLHQSSFSNPQSRNTADHR